MSSNHLGFFSTANRVSPGNYGIKDIKMALEWVQENIHSFGGNPKSVTLMGFSAGSAATHILALSKKTEGLFHRYILHSGSALSTWSVHPPRRYRQICLKLAELVGCQVPKKDIIPSKETIIENPKGEDRRTTAYIDILRNPNSVRHFTYYTTKDDDEIMRCMRTIDAKKLEIAVGYFVSTINKNIDKSNNGTFTIIRVSLFGRIIRGVSLVPHWRTIRKMPF